MPPILDTESRQTWRAKINAAIAALEGMAKGNLVATAAPAATDDANKGYSIGSAWMIAATGEMWRARDVTPNAAVWTKVDTADFDTFRVGRYYLPFGCNPPGSGSATTANAIRMFYGVIKQRVTIDQLAFRATAAAGNIQLAIYRSVGGKPTGLPVAKTASVSITDGTARNVAPDTGNVTLEPGPYWFASNLDASANCIVLVLGPSMASLVGSALPLDILTGQPIQGLAISQAFGTWPDLTSIEPSVVTGNYLTPAILFRVASVP